MEDWDYLEMMKGKPFERIPKAKRRIHLRQERTHCMFHKWVTIYTRQTCTWQIFEEPQLMATALSSSVASRSHIQLDNIFQSSLKLSGDHELNKISSSLQNTKTLPHKPVQALTTPFSPAEHLREVPRPN